MKKEQIQKYLFNFNWQFIEGIFHAPQLIIIRKFDIFLQCTLVKSMKQMQQPVGFISVCSKLGQESPQDVWKTAQRLCFFGGLRINILYSVQYLYKDPDQTI